MKMPVEPYKLPPDKQRAEITPWVAHLSAQYSPRLLPALLMAWLSPARAQQARPEIGESGCSGVTIERP